jgi:hypothetical protein
VYFESFYIAAAQRHPNAKLGQVNFADDAAQRRFMSLLGTPVKQLTKPLTCNLNEVRIDAPGFRSFIYPGKQHVILRTDAVYTTRCEGQSLVSWVGRSAGRSDSRESLVRRHDSVACARRLRRRFPRLPLECRACNTAPPLSGERHETHYVCRLPFRALSHNRCTGGGPRRRRSGTGFLAGGNRR